MMSIVKNCLVTVGLIFVLCGCSAKVESGEHVVGVEFEPSEQSILKVVYWNTTNGMSYDADNDYARFTAWVAEQNPDVLAVCEADAAMLADKMEAWGHSYIAVADDERYPVVVTSRYETGIAESVAVADGKSALHVTVGDIHFVVMDIDRTLAPLAACARMVSVLDATYDNRSYVAEKWVVGGSMYHLSVMDMDDAPDMYPSRIDADEYRFDLYAWNENLVDCIAQLYKFFIPTYTPTDASSEAYRADYVYVSKSIYQGCLDSAEIIDDDFAARASEHKPIVLTVRY
ncbi:MAG: endonuclease/exonuclease/phosphatase family protein [Alistipes sp.]|nr:endonuclease/exonuclease/phosphatase family protein [Alistipes sp.]